MWEREVDTGKTWLCKEEKGKKRVIRDLYQSSALATCEDIGSLREL
jgi:hypothetical protein